MENYDIPDEDIQASSEDAKDGDYARNARLNGGSKWEVISDPQPWIQADIGYQTYVSGVITQGDGYTGVLPGTYADWVTSFNVSTFLTSTDDTEVFVVNEHGDPVVII